MFNFIFHSVNGKSNSSGNHIGEVNLSSSRSIFLILSKRLYASVLSKNRPPGVTIFATKSLNPLGDVPSRSGNGKLHTARSKKT